MLIEVMCTGCALYLSGICFLVSAFAPMAPFFNRGGGTSGEAKVCVSTYVLATICKMLVPTRACVGSGATAKRQAWRVIRQKFFPFKVLGFVATVEAAIYRDRAIGVLYVMRLRFKLCWPSNGSLFGRLE